MAGFMELRAPVGFALPKKRREALYGRSFAGGDLVVARFGGWGLTAFVAASFSWRPAFCGRYRRAFAVVVVARACTGKF